MLSLSFAYAIGEGFFFYYYCLFTALSLFCSHVQFGRGFPLVIAGSARLLRRVRGRVRIRSFPYIAYSMAI